MLVLKDIKKDYVGKNETVHALKGVDISFRECEFVSILGPSGCGKTTLLNILGGLDHYTSGDLIINGRSTREYTDKDWDSYRNHRVGFVFQSYNLISHQTVLSNVELALTLSGVSKTERRERAVKALERVGLSDQIHKKPNQLSGGQMQRVAIARALVNDPDILLADEPTGALDTQTSIQVLDILKEVANDRLVVMVTHNPELAERYSTRIVRLLDGKITGDSDPFDPGKEEGRPAAGKDSKTSMSFATAFALSLKNLLTKKRRTIMTAIAGSIGIIGIALILSLSTGFQNYINRVESQTLSNYPITVESRTVDFSSLMATFMSMGGGRETEHGLDKVYSNSITGDILNAMMTQVKANDMESFKHYLEDRQEELDSYVSGIEYLYDLELPIYSQDTSKGPVQVNPSTIMERMSGSSDYSQMRDMMTSFGSSSFSRNSSVNAFSQLMSNRELLMSQYELVSGSWPNEYDEVAFIVTRDNEMSDMMMYTLNLRDPSEVEGMMRSLMAGETISTEEVSFEYDEILSLRFMLVLPQDCYEKDDGGVWRDMRSDKDFMTSAVENGVPLKVTGIIRPSDEGMGAGQYGSVAYLPELVEYCINEINDSEIVKDQLASPDTDIFTGIAFSSGEEDGEITMDDVNAYIEQMPQEQKDQIQPYLSSMSEEQIIQMFAEQMEKQVTDATYDGNLRLLGVTDEDKPSLINIYPVDFESKDHIADLISAYNDEMTAAGMEDKVISYTDYVGMLMSNVTKIVNTISYVLIAFVAISLVVSSIMIGVITNISVLECTKEIGILHSIGASKKDITHVFNAETFIIGLAAGVFGIGITLLLSIPINSIIQSLTGIRRVATLEPLPAVILIIISVLLTLIAGLIPARSAAKKDPVEALRTE